MTADRPRLAAAADAVCCLYDDSVPKGLALPSMDEVAHALAPYVPERDELVAELRLALGKLIRERSEIEAKADSDHDTGGGFIDFGEYLSAVTGLPESEIDALALLARHAPEQPDG